MRGGRDAFFWASGLLLLGGTAVVWLLLWTWPDHEPLDGAFVGTTTTSAPPQVFVPQLPRPAPYHETCDCTPCLERVRALEAAAAATTTVTLPRAGVETPRWHGDVARRCQPKDFDAIYRAHVDWFDRHPWRPNGDGCNWTNGFVTTQCPCPR